MNDIFNLRMQAKTLARQSKKLEKEHNDYKKKVKKAMEQGNMDVARVYCETAIHKKSMANNLLKMSSRVDAISMKLQAQIRQNQTIKMLGKVTKDLEIHMKSMNIEGISKTMDMFSEQFENIDVATSVMEQGLDKGTQAMTDQNQVTSLLNEIADEHNMDIQSQLEDAGLADKPLNIKNKNNNIDEEKEIDNDQHKLQGLMDI